MLFSSMASRDATDLSHQRVLGLYQRSLFLYNRATSNEELHGLLLRYND